MSDIQTETYFKDLIDTPHLINDEDRLPGRGGVPGAGLKISEAVPLAQSWWDTKARFMMPDYGKDPHEQIIKSGIMMGLPWFNLSKQEMLRVLAQWYAHVGINLIVDGRLSSDDAHAKKNMAEIRVDGAEILPVLSDDGTHNKTSIAEETETWADEYKAIELEEKLLNEKGEKVDGS